MDGTKINWMPAVCKAHSEMQSMRLLESLGACPRNSLKMHVLRLDLKHKIAILRAGSGKSVVSEISLVVHARVANPERARASFIL